MNRSERRERTTALVVRDHGHKDVHLRSNTDDTGDEAHATGDDPPGGVDRVFGSDLLELRFHYGVVPCRQIKTEINCQAKRLVSLEVGIVAKMNIPRKR